MNNIIILLQIHWLTGAGTHYTVLWYPPIWYTTTHKYMYPFPDDYSIDGIQLQKFTDTF